MSEKSRPDSSTFLREIIKCLYLEQYTKYCVSLSFFQVIEGFAGMRTDKLLWERIDHSSAEWRCTRHDIIVKQSEIEIKSKN